MHLLSTLRENISQVRGKDIIKILNASRKPCLIIELY